MGKDALKLTISKMITLAITLITNILLSRFRTLTEYGTFSQLLLVVNLFVAIFSLGLPNSINYFLARASTDEDKRAFLSTFYSANTVLSITTGSLLVVAIPLISSYFNNPTLLKYWFVLAFLPWCSIIKSTISNLLIIYKKTNLLLFFNFVSASSVLGAVVFVFIHKISFYYYMIIFIIIEILICIWIYIIAFKLAKGMVASINWQLLKTIILFSIPLGVASSISTLNSELDKMIIGRLMSTEEVALYSNAAKELPITIIPSSFTAILMPAIARDIHEKKNSEAVQKWSLGIEMGYLIICFFSMVCIVFAHQIVAFLYSEKYIAGVQVFRVYSAVILLRITYFGMILNCTGKTKFVFYTTIVSLVLNCFLNIILFKIFGFIGPALATFISVFFIQFMQLLFTCRIIDVPFRHIFPWKKIIDISIINAFLGLISYMFLKLFNIGYDSHGILVAIGFVFLILIIYAFAVRKQFIRIWEEMNQF